MPIINQIADKSEQIIQRASLTVNSQIIPSRLNSNIKPKGALNERQKKKNTSPINSPQIIWLTIVKPPIVHNISPVIKVPFPLKLFFRQRKKNKKAATAATAPQINPFVRSFFASCFSTCF